MIDVLIRPGSPASRCGPEWNPKFVRTGQAPLLVLAESQLRGGMKFAAVFNLVKLKPQQMTVDMKLVSR